MLLFKFLLTNSSAVPCMLCILPSAGFTHLPPDAFFRPACPAVHRAAAAGSRCLHARAPAGAHGPEAREHSAAVGRQQRRGLNVVQVRCLHGLPSFASTWR